MRSESAANASGNSNGSVWAPSGGHAAAGGGSCSAYTRAWQQLLFMCTCSLHLEAQMKYHRRVKTARLHCCAFCIDAVETWQENRCASAN